MGRAFVVKVAAGTATPAIKVEEMIQSLRDSSGQWRDLEVDTIIGGTTRVYLGRDKRWAQLQVEITGKKMVAMLAKRLPQADIFHRHRDGMILVDRQPVIKLEELDGSTPSLKWNMKAMQALKLRKEELLAELGQTGPAGAGQVAWES